MRNLITISLLLLTTATAGATSVTGNVSGTWSLAGSPYIVDGDVTVPTGQTLTIAPGVEVRFNGHFKFIVNGALDAQGGAATPITFTRHQATDASRGWGIRFVNANAVQSNLRHCIIEWNDSRNATPGIDEDDMGGGIFIKNSVVVVSESEIRNNFAQYGGGIAVFSTATAVIERNRIHDNAVDPAALTIYAGGAGIGLLSATNGTRIFNNLIYRNTRAASANSGNFEGGGGLQAYGGAPVIASNTFWGNSDAKGSGMHLLAVSGSTITAVNNIVWGNTGSVNPGQVTVEVDYNPGGTVAPGLLLSYNVVQNGIIKVYRNTFEANIAGIATSTTDPRLFDPSNGKFELEGTSPAIDAANMAVSGAQPTDYYGSSRFDVAAVADTGVGSPTYADRGAIEFVDTDGDGIANTVDNCGVANTNQLDSDGDGAGDACDTDDDNDGSLDGSDCDPTNATIYPGASELCDAIDQDCDGSLVETFANSDGDSEPNCIDSDDDNDLSLDANDCQPLDASIHPLALESCDLVDSNCNGSLVDGFANYDGDAQPDCVDPDDDNDGSTDANDCAPSDPAIRPGAAETCDMVDSDCDGSLVDTFANQDGDSLPNCVDADDDADGIDDTADCAPLDGTRYPGAAELCDAIDSNCDGSLVDGFANNDADPAPDCIDLDDDNDSSQDTADCAPFDSTIYPGATEACDLIDSNCDGSLVDTFTNTDGDARPNCVDADDDNDGANDGADCASTDAAIYPGASEACDLIDSNCDGSLVDGFTNTDSDSQPNCVDADDDNDGEDDVSDCDALDATVHPGATETCDAIDSDCDGSLVDSFTDIDADEEPDCIDTDDDDDGVPDATDNCPMLANPDQKNTDGAGGGDACTDDRDGDGVLDVSDNCADIDNADQHDSDTDNIGDACDVDDDGDGVVDDSDVCPALADPDQLDLDEDGAGDACDADDDGDSIDDEIDNCATEPNADQADRDHDGNGDACDDAPPHSGGCNAGHSETLVWALFALGLLVRRRRAITPGRS